MAGRIHQYVERMMRSRAEIFDEASRKRALVDQTAGDAKRQKMEGAPQFTVPPLGPGPHSLAGVFTLTNNLGLAAFDATQLPANLAAKISVKTLMALDQQILDLAVAVCVLHIFIKASMGVLTWLGYPGSSDFYLRCWSGGSSGSSACSHQRRNRTVGSGGGR
jgi:hypothetical protein